MSVNDPDPAAPTTPANEAGPAPDPTIARDAAAEPGAAVPSDPPPKRRRAVVTRVATSVVLVLALALAGYLYWTTAEWQREAETLSSHNARLQQEVDTLSSDLDQTVDELEAANDRLLDLAGEHAQTTDEREMLRQLAERNADLAEENADLAEQQNEIAVAASTAAARLSECASGQNEVLQQLLAGEQADESTLDGVNADCQAAQQARDTLAQLLDG